MPEPARPVSAFLAASPRARLEGAVALGSGRSAAIWTNRQDQVSYVATAGHTFSYYLRGGDGTWRTDIRPVHGCPGAVCIMPEGQTSDWDITGPFEFVHLYLPDSELRRAFSEIFDRDARLMQLDARTYADLPELESPFRALVQAVRGDAPLAAEGAVSTLIATAFAGQAGRNAARPITGGLAPRLARRLRDYIEARLDQPIRLDELAAEAGLSAFHLHRAFHASFGVSPQGWISHRRIVRAKALLCAGEPMAQIAAACGYSSQSHFSRSFRAATGATPSDFRRTLGAARPSRD